MRIYRGGGAQVTHLLAILLLRNAFVLNKEKEG
jgi:hypothetical protein